MFVFLVSCLGISLGFFWAEPCPCQMWTSWVSPDPRLPTFFNSMFMYWIIEYNYINWNIPYPCVAFTLSWEMVDCSPEKPHREDRGDKKNQCINLSSICWFAKSPSSRPCPGGTSSFEPRPHSIFSSRGLMTLKILSPHPGEASEACWNGWWWCVGPIPSHPWVFPAAEVDTVEYHTGTWTALFEQ